jgi:uncharacterized RDD family membrane protein YckC
MADPSRPAGFWVRAVAAVVDFVVFLIVQASYRVIARLFFGVDAWALGPVVSGFTLLFALVYTTVLHSMAGQTIGKMLLQVRVVGMDDEPPPFGASLLRFVSYLLSLAPLGFGYVMAGLRSDKRALHDLIAGTRVERIARLRTEPEPVVEPPEEVAPPVT